MIEGVFYAGRFYRSVVIMNRKKIKIHVFRIIAQTLIGVLFVLNPGVMSGQESLSAHRLLPVCLSPGLALQELCVRDSFLAGQNVVSLLPSEESPDQVRSAKRKWLSNLILRNPQEKIISYLRLAVEEGVLEEEEGRIIEIAVRDKLCGPDSLDKAAAEELDIPAHKVTRDLMGRSETDTVSIGFYERLGGVLRGKKSREALALKAGLGEKFRGVILEELVDFFHFTVPWSFSRQLMGEVFEAWPEDASRWTGQRKTLLQFWWENPGKTVVEAAAELGMTRGNLRKRLNSAQQEMIAVAVSADLLEPLMNLLERRHAMRSFKYLTGKFSRGELKVLYKFIAEMDAADFQLKDLPRSAVEKMIRLRLSKNRSYQQLARQFGLSEASVNRFFEGRNPSLFREERKISVPGALEKFRRFLEIRLSEELQIELEETGRANKTKLHLIRAERDYGISLPRIRENIFLKQTEMFLSGKRRFLSGKFDLSDCRIEIWGRCLNGLALPTKNILTVKVFFHDDPEAGFVFFPEITQPRLIFFGKKKGRKGIPEFYQALIDRVYTVYKKNNVETRRVRKNVFEYLFYYAGVYIYQKNLDRPGATPLSAFRKTLAALESFYPEKSNPSRLNNILRSETGLKQDLKSADWLYKYFQERHNIDVMQEFGQEMNGDGFVFPAFQKIYEELKEKEDLPWFTPAALENLLSALNYQVTYSNVQYLVYRHWKEAGHDIFQYWRQNEEKGAAWDENISLIAGKVQLLGDDVLPLQRLNGKAEYYVRSILQSSGLVNRSLKEALLDTDEKGASLYEKILADDTDLEDEILTKVDIDRFMSTLTPLEQGLVKAVILGYSLEELDLDRETREKVFFPLVSKAEKFFSGGRVFDESV